MKRKTLILVESPKKAKTILKYLGEDKYEVLATFGHIKQLSETKKPNLTWGIDFKNDFKIHYEIMPSKLPLINTIIKNAKQADRILLASDPDREGEAIAAHLFQCLETCDVEIKRVHFHEITEKAIKKSIKNAKDIDYSLYNAQQARRALDRIVGYSVSDFLRNKNSGASAGRVQSVALKLITEKEKAITNFIPEKYLTIQADGFKDNVKFDIKYFELIKNLTPEQIEKANKIHQSLINENLFVSNFKAENKQKEPLPPFTTLTMTSAAHSKLSWAAAKTMANAQALYESGLITYMRTDSVRANPDFIKESQNFLKEKYDLPKETTIYQNKNSIQDAHECIRPTFVDFDPDNMFLPQENKELLKLIYNRFMASLLKPAIFATSTIELTNKSDYKFKTLGKILQYKGWMELYDETNSSDKLLPPLNIGDNVLVKNATIKDRYTLPPTRFNERSLIEELEKKDIGRPSTYASIIPKLVDKHYLVEEKNGLVPSELGTQVIDSTNPHFSFMEYAYTANMEKELDNIAEGSNTYEHMMNDFYSSFKKELNLAYAKVNNISNIKCEICGEFTEKFVKNDITYIHCVNYPDCKFKSRQKNEKDFPLENGEKLCKKCDFFTARIMNERFGAFDGCQRYPRCK